MKILVIEDEPGAADYLRQGLMESGYAVEVAPTERTACTRRSTAIMGWGVVTDSRSADLKLTRCSMTC